MIGFLHPHGAVEFLVPTFTRLALMAMIFKTPEWGQRLDRLDAPVTVCEVHLSQLHMPSNRSKR